MRMEGRFFKNQTYVDTVYIYIERDVYVCMYGMLCFVLFCNVMYVCNVMFCFVL